MEAILSDEAAANPDGLHPEALISDLTLLHPTTVMGTAIVDNAHRKIANRLLRRGMLELVSTMSKAPIFSVLLLPPDACLSPQHALPLPAPQDKQNLPRPFSEACLATQPTAAFFPSTISPRGAARRFSVNDVHGVGFPTRAPSMSTFPSSGTSLCAAPTASAAPRQPDPLTPASTTTAPPTGFAPLSLDLHRISREDLFLQSPQMPLRSPALSGTDGFPRFNTVMSMENLVDDRVEESLAAQQREGFIAMQHLNHNTSTDRRDGGAAGTSQPTSTPPATEPFQGSMLSLTPQMRMGMSFESFDLLRQSVSVMDARGSTCRERPSAAMKQGGCIIFTDDYYDYNNRSPVSLIAEEYRRYHSERKIDRSYLNNVKAKSYITKEIKSLYVEGQIGIRPIFRRRPPEDVYGSSEYIPAQHPTLVANDAHVLSDSTDHRSQDPSPANSSEEQSEEDGLRHPQSDVNQSSSRQTLSRSTKDSVRSALYRVRHARSESEDGSITDDAPTDAPLVALCHTPESPLLR